MSTEIKKGSPATLRIENVAFGGKGIARVDGYVVFVEGGLPGDLVLANVTKRKSQFAEAVTEKVLEPSPSRILPRCEVFGICGGCKWQNYEYSQQLIAKQDHVADALKHIAKLHKFEMRPILPSPNQWNYRNKMEFSFGTDAETGKIIVGFHKSGDFRTIISAGDVCKIQPPGLDEVMAWIAERVNKEAAREGEHFRAYRQSNHTGFLRHLVLRYSHTTGKFLIAILSASGKWDGAKAFGEDLMARFPACIGYQWGTTDSLSDVARMEKQKLQLGETYIYERLGDKEFRVSTFSFFQTNTPGAEVLYGVVRDFAGLTGKETVLDAYCGTGTIGIYLSDQAKQVVGIEIIKDAVWDARYNAKANNAENCTFLAGEMRDVLPTVPFTSGLNTFDTVIVDPPRGGMDKKSLRQIIAIGAPVIVYVSCNPATLARDSVALHESGYYPEVVQPVDMFPHTYHVESVIRFRKGEIPTKATASEESDGLVR